MSSVRDLGIYKDADLVMRKQVTKTVLCRVCSSSLTSSKVRRCVPASTFQSLVQALVISRLDYGNGVMIGLPVYLMRRLQSVISAAARADLWTSAL